MAEPGPEAEVEEPHLTVAAVARRLGVAPATLRTWDRRYGLGPSAHAAGAHRRYSPADVARLQAMRRLTAEGVPPAEAARLALQGGEALAAGSARPAAAWHGGGSGGRVLRLPNAEPDVRGLARAAMALDAATVTSQLGQAAAATGVPSTWELLLRPVLVGIGERWAATGDGVDVEHLLSQCASAIFRQFAAALTVPANTRPVVLACAAGELHSLPLDVLAAALAERRIATHVLGAAVPVRGMSSAVRRIGPAALFLWSQLAATASLAQLSAVPATRPPVGVVVGGPGWPADRMPPGVALARDLASAVAMVSDFAVG